MTTISSIDARFAQDKVGSASTMVTASIANLVSGTRADANVADLSVGTILATRVGTLRITVGNAGQAKSLLETAKGALDTVLSLLQQQKNLAVKSADDSLTNNERGFLDQEFQAIVSEINRISENANFNGKTLLDGSISGVSTVNTATGLSSENNGIINAGAVALRGTVATGDLLTTQADTVVNRVAITTGGTSGTTSALTITEGIANGLTSIITFTSGADANSTIDNLVAAFNSLTSDDDTGTSSAKVAQNFRLQNNGDNSFSIIAKEAGDHLNATTVQFTTNGDITAATLGVDAAGEAMRSGDSARALNSNVASPTDTSSGVDGTFMTRAAYNVGETQSSAELVVAGVTDAANDTFTLQITDVEGLLAGAGETVIIVLTAQGTNLTEGEIIESFIEVLNGGVTDEANLTATANITGLTTTTGTADATEEAAIMNAFIMQQTSDTSGSSTATIMARDKGTAFDTFDFRLTGSGTMTTATLGGTTIQGADRNISEGTDLTTGTLRTIATTEATVNTNLVGTFSDMKATFNQAAAWQRNSVQFEVSINGKTYISDLVYLMGGATETDLGAQGNQIAANTEIIFHDPDGPKTSNGDLTDNVFVLKVGTSAVTVSDMTDAAKARESLATIADAFETQLNATAITQDRSLDLTQIDSSSGDHRIKAAVGTILEGIVGFDSVGTNVANFNQGDIRLLTQDFDSSGQVGDIGSFDVDRLRNRITTTVDGVVYTAYLSSDDLPTVGNVKAFGTNLDGTSNVGAYNSTTKILDLQDGTTSSATESITGTAKLHFFSASTTDGRVLIVDLGNVSANTSQINIDSAEGELGLESALNGIFGVSSNDSLSFQVGAASTDTIGVSIGSAKTTDTYKDDNGVAQTISVDTIENAIIAGDIIDNAINSVVSLISDISAKITSFNSAIQNNQASIQNADAARSKLLDTDYTQESTRFAESRVRVDAATAVLSQVNSRIQNLLQLLQQ